SAVARLETGEADVRSSVDTRISASPDSSLATADCDVPIRAATSVWDSPADRRCEVRSATSRRRSADIRRNAISRNPGSNGNPGTSPGPDPPLSPGTSPVPGAAPGPRGSGP